MEQIKISETLKNIESAIKLGLPLDFNKISKLATEFEWFEKELNFYRSIDFLAMGRFIEYEKGCDLTGWEFLAHGWRNENEAKCLWYIQQRWNRAFHFNEIFDEEKDESNKEIRSLFSCLSLRTKLQNETDEELEEAKNRIKELEEQLAQLNMQ